MSAISSQLSFRSSAPWNFNPRVFNIMDSIYAIAFGLGLRTLVDAVSQDLKLTGSLIGLWEGVITLHFLKKMPKSSDPYIAYGVRLFIDFLVTESMERMVLVLIWSAFGLVLADVTPAIWDEVGLNRVWRHFRRDLYTIYDKIPTVAFFPPQRTVRFLPPRERERRRGREREPGEISPSIATSQDTPIAIIPPSPSASEPLEPPKHHVPGYYYSDTDTDFGSINRSRTEANDTIVSDLDEGNQSSAVSSPSLNHDEILHDEMLHDEIPDMEEMLIDIGIEEAPLLPDPAPKQKAFMPPTPSDSVPRRDLQRDVVDDVLHAEPPRQDLLPNILDSVEDGGTFSDDWEMVHRKESDEDASPSPPTPPAKDKPVGDGGLSIQIPPVVSETRRESLPPAYTTHVDGIEDIDMYYNPPDEKRTDTAADHHDQANGHAGNDNDDDNNNNNDLSSLQAGDSDNNMGPLDNPWDMTTSSDVVAAQAQADAAKMKAEEAAAEIVQKQEEEKRLRKEEDERLRKEEDERLRKEDEERVRKEEEEERIRKEEEEERIRKEEEEERIRKEEEEERIRKEAEEERKREEEERKREEEERKREEEERKRKETEERKQKEAEDERIRKEEEERIRKEEEERIRKEEEERIRMEERMREEERIRKEAEDEKIRKEEEERQRKEAEEEELRRETEKKRKADEIAERKKKEDDDDALRKLRQEEAKRQEAERERKAEEDAERKRKDEDALKKKKEEDAERKRQDEDALKKKKEEEEQEAAKKKKEQEEQEAREAEKQRQDEAATHAQNADTPGDQATEEKEDDSKTVHGVDIFRAQDQLSPSETDNVPDSTTPPHGDFTEEESVVSAATTDPPQEAKVRLERMMILRAQMVEVEKLLDELKGRGLDGTSLEIKAAEKTLRKFRRQADRRYDAGIQFTKYSKRLFDINLGALDPQMAGVKIEESLERLLTPASRSISIKLTFGPTTSARKQKPVVLKTLTTYNLLSYTIENERNKKESRIEIPEGKFAQWLTDYRTSVARRDSENGDDEG